MFEPLRLDRHIRSATEAADIALWSFCPETGETWFSDTWYTILGYQPGSFEPSFDVFMGMMHPDDHAMTIRAHEDLVEDRSETYMADFRLLHSDGHWVWIGSSGAKVERDDDLPYVIYGMQLDITERKQTEIELAQIAMTADEHRERLGRLAANSPAALYEFRIDVEGTITLPYLTSGVHEILAVPAEEIKDDGTSVFRNIFEEDMVSMGPAIEMSRQGLSPFRMRYRVKRPDQPNGFIWVQANSVPHREIDGSTIWFGSLYDVTQEVERESQLSEARDAMQHLALHDSLTSLPNRRSFDSSLEERAHVGPKDGFPNAVIVRIDLDRFKYVNDTMGHAAGDAVLVHVSGILIDAADDTDLVSRMGGDEFSVLLGRGKSIEDAARLVDKMQSRLAVPFIFEGKPCRFGASFGIACSDQGDIANGDLMSFADAALYEAKAAGRNRLVIFDNSLHESILDNRRMAAEIEAAIEKREFEPFFQPQVDSKTECLVGAEVLARWRNKRGEIVTPDRFIPIAEQIRAVPLIDSLMVERSVSVISDWGIHGLNLPKVSFNVSPGRLRDSSLVSAVSDLQKRGVLVAFELLESILLEEEDSVVAHNLDLAREAGICIEIDDFGTGHASILGLMHVGPDVLKIDRRLTANVTHAEQARVLVSSILAIARSMDIRTIAEGVETEEQADTLRDLGCDVLQGYLYAGPLDASGFLSWAKEREALGRLAN